MRFSIPYPSEYRRAGQGRHVELTKDLLCVTNGCEWYIPQGYVINGASIPRVFWTFMGSPFDPSNIEGAWPHDYFYLNHLVSRSVADESARQVWAITPGNGPIKARIMWSAVRSPAGAVAWMNNEADLEDLRDLNRLILNTPFDPSRYGYYGRLETALSISA